MQYLLVFFQFRAKLLTIKLLDKVAVNVKGKLAN